MAEQPKRGAGGVSRRSMRSTTAKAPGNKNPQTEAISAGLDKPAALEDTATCSIDSLLSGTNKISKKAKITVKSKVSSSIKSNNVPYICSAKGTKRKFDISQEHSSENKRTVSKRSRVSSATFEHDNTSVCTASDAVVNKKHTSRKRSTANAILHSKNSVQSPVRTRSSRKHIETVTKVAVNQKEPKAKRISKKSKVHANTLSEVKAKNKTGLSKSKASAEVPAASISDNTLLATSRTSGSRRHLRSEDQPNFVATDLTSESKDSSTIPKIKSTGLKSSYRKLSHGSKDRHISTTASTQATSSLLALMSDVDEEGAAGTSKAAVPSAGGQSQDITSSPDVASGTVASTTSLGAMSTESESEETDMSRLQALLEARGLPSHWFGALGPRMQQLLQRSMGNSSTLSKAHQLLQGLQSPDEGQQLTAAIEMCQLLVMGNEDTLAGFPVKQAVPALISLLNADHNFDIMHHACRALTYMMEVLPRSSVVVVDAIPILLEKLQVIQCMDVAEQALQGLEMLSRRHGKAILHAGGVGACLTYIDFFSMPAQRAALSITANCCQSLNAEDYHYVRESASLLSSRLNQQDKKALESICMFFARLVDSYQNDERILKEIAAHGLLPNVQQLLMTSPMLISTGTFVMVVRMLVIMCATCPDLAVIMLKQNIAETVCFLLVGSQLEQGAAQSIELVSRSPQEMFEIACLIGELMPRLPSDGIFSIDNVVHRSNQRYNDAIVWQWRDDRNIWHPYTPIDGRIIEAAYQSGEDEVGLATMGRSYVIDFNTMQQINEDSGTVRPVQRKSTPASSAASGSVAGNSFTTCSPKVDMRAVALQENPQVAIGFVKTLFAVLYEVYNSSAGPSVRHKCLQALLRMLYYSSPEVLRDILSNINTGSHIATMLGSNDLKVVVAALQMANVLMEKLPDVFSVHFQREGVVHQIRRLMEPEKMEINQQLNTNNQPTSLQPVAISFPQIVDISPASQSSKVDISGLAEPVIVSETDRPSSSQLKISEVFKRKKAPKKSIGKKGAKVDDNDTSTGSAMIVDSVSLKGPSTPPMRTTRLGSKEKVSEKPNKSSSLRLPSHPTRWGRSSPSVSVTNNSSLSATVAELISAPAPVKQDALISVPSGANLLAGQKERIKDWIKEQANKFASQYYAEEAGNFSSPGLSVLSRLHQATCALGQQYHDLLALREISAILGESDVSPFEILHSGLVGRLVNYLSDNTSFDRDQHIRNFLFVFINCPEPPSVTVQALDRSRSPSLLFVLNKLLACLHHLEQFQVKVHEVPGGSGTSGRGTSALRFFNTHQLKCNLLRHPLCTSLRQWKGGPVKVDPLALVQAIERCLIMRGYGRPRQEPDDLDGSDDDNSEDDIDDTMAAVSISQGISQHRLEFLIGDHLLPYNMTVYQAIRQFGNVLDHTENSETDTDTDHPFGNAGIWVRTHTIWYRPVTEGGPMDQSCTPKKAKAERSLRGTNRSRKDPLWAEGLCPQFLSALEQYLVPNLPNVTVSDASLEVIALLRILNALNKYWYTMYETSSCELPVSMQEFISAKLTAKANRQLQDPLVIMTGNIPAWLSEIGHVCPFLLPFETRQMLFYATSFDRDRAMQRLQDTTVDSGHTDATDRVAPRLDKRKKVISRDDVLKHAEKVLEDLGNSRAILEIQYDNEVGTGLGPTLEFYALVSQELQRADLELWRGDVLPAKSSDGINKDALYMFSSCGLYPAPLGRHVKAATINKIKSKFRFLGRLMAKAVMDSRVLDLPLSVTFYKWLLGMENTLSSVDLQFVDASLARSYYQLEKLVHQKKKIDLDHTHTSESRQLALDSLTMDGCSVQDLDLDFVLPGYPLIELKKGGKDIPVTLDSLEEYLKLVLHWTLNEGVRKQMESFREGFESLVPLTNLSLFYPEELSQLFCGSQQELWETKYLMDCCRTDHGYTHESRVVRLFFEMLSSYDSQQQRRFLQFVTGSPRLPVGGLRSLNPPLTIVRKTCEADENADAYLPSVMTCVNYLKLPEYSSLEVMRVKVETAIYEGQLSFHLS